MGDFDVKPNNQSGAEKQKIAVLSVLGVVLAGVLGYHFFGRGAVPAVASSSGIAAGAPASTADLSPQAVRDSLRDDPTAQLLLGTSRPNPALEKTPRNPFRISQDMRISLTKVVDPAPQPVQRVEVPTISVDPTPLPRISPSLRAEDFKLSTIVSTGGDRPMAVVNSTVLSAGSVINNARVLEIRSDRVVLQHVDSTDGAKLELLLERPRK